MLPDSTTFRLKPFKKETHDEYDMFVMGNIKMIDVILKKL